MDFQVGDKVMLKVSPWKGVIRFGKWGKFNPRYVGPFKVLNTFHVSNLKKCYSDDPLFVPLEGLQVDDKLHFVKEPVEIRDREVMVAPVIYISSNSSDESVGSSILRVILIGFIPIEVPVAIASPAGVLKLDTHSSSEADLLDSSLPPVQVAPMVSPFLYLDDSESDIEMLGRHVSSTPHDAMLARWRNRVASRSSSPTTSTSEIPTAPIPPVPSAIDIPVGRLYRIHPGRPCRALKARKSVRPLPSHRLALRYTSHHLDRFTSRSSSDHSSSDHSSADHSLADHTLGHSTLDQSLSRHTSPDTTIADSSTPSRFVYPPPTRTSQAGNSSSESSVRPSRKRCRSPTTSVPSSIPALGALVPTRADLLPPRNRFRDSYSSEDSVKEDIDADVLVDIEADATVVEVAADIDVKAGVDTGIGIEIRDDIEDEDEGEAESSDRGTMEVEEVVHDIYGHVMEIPLHRLEDIESGHRELEVRSLIAGGERAASIEIWCQQKRKGNEIRNGEEMETRNGSGNGKRN
ncbi:hypothetical protein Tco_1407023 [Tanacetum coccineum]